MKYKAFNGGREGWFVATEDESITICDIRNLKDAEAVAKLIAKELSEEATVKDSSTVRTERGGMNQGDLVTFSQAEELLKNGTAVVCRSSDGDWGLIKNMGAFDIEFRVGPRDLRATTKNKLVKYEKLP